MWTLLDNLDAFYLEHRRCGKLDAHVEDRRVWIISGGHFDEAGEFPEGSMGPKARAAVEFIERRGKRPIMIPLDYLQDAIAGRTGTHVVDD